MWTTILVVAMQFTSIETNEPIVIAHRGASGYAVEHTEAAKAMAHAQSADYIEQDVVLTKDGQFVVTHDITMEETTNVETCFADRARKDGSFYFADFLWSEIQQLETHERTRKGSAIPAMPDRFPGSAGQRIVRLVDEIKMIRGWNQTTGKSTGFYIELKAPSFHKEEFVRSMGEDLLRLLEDLKVDNKRCFIQCFEREELIDLHERLRCPFPLIQLLGKAPSNDEIEAMAKYANGIGPSLELIAERDSNKIVKSTGLVEAAKKYGLMVHPYTVRKHAQPNWSNSLDETLQFMLDVLRVDGFFTDYPDLGRSAVAGSQLRQR